MKFLVLGVAAVSAILTAFVLRAEDQGECIALLAHPSGDRVGYRDGDTWYDDGGEMIALDEKTRIIAGSVGCPDWSSGVDKKRRMAEPVSRFGLRRQVA